MPGKHLIPAEFRSLIESRDLFSDLPASAINELMKGGRLRSIKGSEHLIDENQPNEFLFLVIKGTAIAMINKTEVGRIETGEFAGEISSAGISPPVASVVAENACDVAAFPVSLIHDLAEQHPAFAKRLREAGFHRISD